MSCAYDTGGLRMATGSCKGMEATRFAVLLRTFCVRRKINLINLDSSVKVGVQTQPTALSSK